MHFSLTHRLCSAALLLTFSSPVQASDVTKDESNSAAASPESSQAYPPCSHEPTANDISAAKGAYQAGQVSFQEADYDHALLYWEDAFRRDCTAIKLLLNIARAYELSGERTHAVDALQTYLLRQQDGSDGDSIEKRIAKLQERIAQDEREATIAARPAPTPEPAHEPSVATAAKPERPSWPVFVTAGGAVTAVVGAVLAITGENAFATLVEENACNLETGLCKTNEGTSAFNAKAPGIKTRRNVGIGMTVAGSAVAVVGGVLWYWMWNHDAPTADLGQGRHFSWQPVVGSQYQGLNFGGTF